MNPVVGLDISKGESQVQAFLDKKKPYRKSFKVEHTNEGLALLHEFLKHIKETTRQNPQGIIMLPLFNFWRIIIIC